MVRETVKGYAICSWYLRTTSFIFSDKDCDFREMETLK